MLKVVFKQNEPIGPKEKVKRRVPLYKDADYMEALRIQFLTNHNAKIERQNKKSEC